MTVTTVFRTLLLVCALVLVNCGVCCTPGLNGPGGRCSAAGGRHQPPAVTNVIGNVSAAAQSPWTASPSEVSGREDLESVHYLDERRGWVGGRGALYETSDGGRSWERVRVEVPSDTSVAHLSFPDASLGWAALQRAAPDASRSGENRIDLLQSGDGGGSWRLQFTEERAAVTRMAFLNEREGWVVGYKYAGPLPGDTSPLVLYTSDQGNHWIDVSGRLSRAAVNDEGFVVGWIGDVIAEAPSTATVLASGGQLFRTDDGGQTWAQVAERRREFSGMSPRRFGCTEGRLRWVAASQLDESGVFSLLTVEQPDGSWENRHLGGVYLKDVLYLSENEVLTAGSILPEVPRGDLNHTDGVVLYSSDGGREWSIVYRSTRVRGVNALAAVSRENIRAVGDGGLVLEIKPASAMPTARLK